MHFADNILVYIDKISCQSTKTLALICLGLALVFNCNSTLADSANKLNITLPDLGEPSSVYNSFDYNINKTGGSASYKTELLNSRFSINPGYNLSSGINLGATAGTKISDKLAIGFVPSVDPNKRELLFNTGVDLKDNQRLIYSVSQLHQKLNLSSVSGTTDKYSSQFSHAFSYKYLFQNSSDSSFGLDTYVSEPEAQKPNRLDQTSLITNPLAQAGGKMDGVRGQLSVKPTSDSNLKFGLSRERLKFVTNSDYSTQYLANVEWDKSVNSNLYFNAGVDLQDTQESYKLGLVQLMSKRNQKVGLNLMAVRNENNLANDNLVQITYSYKFGGLFSNPLVPSRYAKNQSGWSNALSDKVTTRPTFIPVNIPTY